MVFGIDDFLLFPIRTGLGIVGVIIGILLLIFWIWMIVDAVKRSFRNDIEKVLWIVVIVIATWVGAIVYYVVIRSLNPHGLAKK